MTSDNSNAGSCNNGYMTSDNEHDDGLPVRVTVRLSRLAAARLRDLADERGTTVSRVIRAALADTRRAASN